MPVRPDVDILRDSARTLARGDSLETTLLGMLRPLADRLGIASAAVFAVSDPDGGLEIAAAIGLGDPASLAAAVRNPDHPVTRTARERAGALTSGRWRLAARPCAATCRSSSVPARANAWSASLPWPTISLLTPGRDPSWKSSRTSRRLPSIEGSDPAHLRPGRRAPANHGTAGATRWDAGRSLEQGPNQPARSTSDRWRARVGTVIGRRIPAATRPGMASATTAATATTAAPAHTAGMSPST